MNLVVWCFVLATVVGLAAASEDETGVEPRSKRRLGISYRDEYVCFWDRDDKKPEHHKRMAMTLLDEKKNDCDAKESDDPTVEARRVPYDVRFESEDMRELLESISPGFDASEICIEMGSNRSLTSRGLAMKEKRRILEDEQKISIGSRITLSDKERKANRLLMELKIQEIEDAEEDKGEFYPGEHFLTVKDGIEQSEVFKFIKRMPKGALLRGTASTQIDIKTIERIILKSKNLYAKINGKKLSLSYFEVSPSEDSVEPFSDYSNREYYSRRNTDFRMRSSEPLSFPEYESFQLPDSIKMPLIPTKATDIFKILDDKGDREKASEGKANGDNGGPSKGNGNKGDPSKGDGDKGDRDKGDRDKDGPVQSSVGNSIITAGSTSPTTAGSNSLIAAGSTSSTTAGSIPTTTAGSTSLATSGSTSPTTTGPTPTTTAGPTPLTTAGSITTTTAGSISLATAGSTSPTTTGPTPTTTAGPTPPTTAGSTSTTTAGSKKPATAGSKKPATAGSTSPTTAGSIPTTAGSTSLATAGSTSPTTVGPTPTTAGPTPSTTAGSTSTTTAGSISPTTAGSTSLATAGSTSPTTTGPTPTTTAGPIPPTTAGSTSTTTAGSKKPATAGSKKPVTAGSTSPTTAGSIPTTTAGSASLATAGSTSPTTTGPSPTTTAGPTPPTTAGSTSTTTAGSKKPATAGSTSPTTAGSIPTPTAGSTSLGTAGSTSPTTAGPTPTTTAGPTPPTTAGSTSTTTAGSTSPTTAGSKKPATVGSPSPATAGATSPATAGSSSTASKHPKDNGMWVKISDLKGTEKLTNIIKMIIKAITIQFDDHNLPPTGRKVRELMRTGREILDVILNFRPNFLELFEESLKLLYNDGIHYAELRTDFPEVYELNGLKYKPAVVMTMYRNKIRDFRKKHPDFLGVKFIYAPQRSDNFNEIEKQFNIFYEVYKQYPKMLVGMDLAGPETNSKALNYYFKALFNLPPNIRFYFQAGLSNWWATDSDRNILDAYVAKASRISHAHALVKHPLALKKLRARSIPVEFCPIFTQVTGFVGDLRNSPLSYLFATDYPIVIGNEEPLFWGGNGLSYDFYAAFMALTSKDGDLRALKQLALNSWLYSSLPTISKKIAIEAWEKQWMQFVRDIDERVQVKSQSSITKISGEMFGVD